MEKKPHQYFLYFAGSDGLTEQIGLATSPDQRQWHVSPQPVIPVGQAGAWDNWQTSNPCVLLEEGRFRMWYQGVDARKIYRIGYATSEDGHTWHKQPDVCFERPGIGQREHIPRREGYHQPLVLRHDGRYWMYFLDYRDRLGYIRVAHSPDGLAWEVHPDDCLAPDQAWEQHGLHYPWVIHDGERFVMWYTSTSPKTRWYLNRAVSEDGLRWERDPATPIIDLAYTRRHSRFNTLLPRRWLRLLPHAHHPNSPKRTGGHPLWLNLHDRWLYPLRNQRYLSFNNSSVVQRGPRDYLMYFQALTEGGELRIGAAQSNDGITWHVQDLNMLRAAIEGEGIAWCDAFAGDPHLVSV